MPEQRAPPVDKKSDISGRFIHLCLCLYLYFLEFIFKFIFISI